MNVKNQYDIVFPNGEVKNLSLEEIFASNEKTLLYFYPKDNTPGCTLENKDFTCEIQTFKNLGITLIGVSKDTVASHQKFIL
jgi:peroxiredoxin Q/BCP